MNTIAAVILAAGKGTRMKSRFPKVVHEVCGVPLIVRLVRQLKQVGIRTIVVVVGYQKENVKEILKQENVLFVEQERQRGTGHALLVSQRKIPASARHILVLGGDVFFEKKEILKKLCTDHLKKRTEMSILTAVFENPYGYGRILRDADNTIVGIREEVDATREERRIHEINTGVYVFKKQGVFSLLRKVQPNNKKKEYYLTSLIGLYIEKNKSVEGVRIIDNTRVLGINDRAQLAGVIGVRKDEIIACHQKNGVTILDPTSTYIEEDVVIGNDTVIYPYTYIEKKVRIGRECVIGPFCKIRTRSRVKNNSCIGSFVELVRSQVGSHTNIKHLSYIGDAVVGNRVNVGAGTITANYDGKKKSKTQIGDCAFIGSNTVFIAPLSVGKGAQTGAGAVIPHRRHIPAGTIAVGVPARIVKQK